LKRQYPRNAFCEFTLERPVALIRRDLEIPNIRLEDYVVGNSVKPAR